MSLLPAILYGVFARWPEDGKAWIHVDDVRLVRKLIPSPRIFRRDQFDGEFNVMRYGPLTFRVRPTLWMVIEPDGFDIGDWVEIRSLLGKNEPGLACIREMCWHERSGEIRYYVDRHNARNAAEQHNSLHFAELTVERGQCYSAIDLQTVDHIPLESGGVQSLVR